MTEIKTWQQRCMEHPYHQTGMVSDEMIYARMCEEIEELRAEIERLRARVEVLEQHLRDAVSVADMAMSDANGCDCHTDAKWDRDAELEVFRAALEAKP
jgi:hypothetical protein